VLPKAAGAEIVKWHNQAETEDKAADE